MPPINGEEVSKKIVGTFKEGWHMINEVFQSHGSIVSEEKAHNFFYDYMYEPPYTNKKIYEKNFPM